MIIGLPRALLYYKYKYLWETFFSKLGCEIILSEESNKKILSDGINFSIDECCLPAKIYMGHVYSLIGKCDYILVPRVDNFGAKDKVCVKFNAMYDIVRNTFSDVKLLDYNLDSLSGNGELNGFVNMGRTLKKGYIETLSAYYTAKRIEAIKKNQDTLEQNEIIENEHKLKVLVISHPYNVYDKLLGYPVIELIKKMGGIPVYADSVDRNESIKKSKEISNSLYWIYSKELIGAIEIYKDKIDGIILLTAFPCGPDSLVNEMIIRKYKSIPIINIILDELQGEAGLQTRIESFIDIISERRSEKLERSSR